MNMLSRGALVERETMTAAARMRGISASLPAKSQGVAPWMRPPGPMTKMLMMPVSSTPAMPTPDMRSNFLVTTRERIPYTSGRDRAITRAQTGPMCQKLSPEGRSSGLAGPALQ